MFIYILGLFRFWSLSLTYLRFQFKQTFDKIDHSIRTHDLSELKNALAEHNYCCLKTSQLNVTFNYFLVVMYLLAQPALNMLIYVSHSPETDSILRFAAGTLFGVCFVAIFTVNLLCASVTACAHKPLRIMYRLSKKDSIPVKENLKMMAFIEKLRGPVIGFYCHKLYPVNNYYFYKYICGWAINYFLIINLINDHLI